MGWKLSWIVMVFMISNLRWWGQYVISLMSEWNAFCYSCSLSSTVCFLIVCVFCRNFTLPFFCFWWSISHCIQVNERIIETAGILHDCDLCLKKHSNFFRSHEHLLLEVSQIDTQGWGSWKLATAIRIVCCPYVTTTEYEEVNIL